MSAAVWVALVAATVIAAVGIAVLVRDVVVANREARDWLRRIPATDPIVLADEFATEIAIALAAKPRNDREMPSRALTADELTESARLIDAAFATEESN